MTVDRIKEIQLTTGYPDSVSVQQALLQVWNEVEQESNQVQAVVMPDEVVGGQHLTDEEFETLSIRITPSLYDVVLDGVDESKADLFRKLRIIINDIITTRQKGNKMILLKDLAVGGTIEFEDGTQRTIIEKLPHQEIKNAYYYKFNDGFIERDIRIRGKIVSNFITDGSEQTTSEPIPPKTQNLYVYVTELLKEDAEPYRDGKREAIHEIPISYGLPIELIYGFVVGELERVYMFERSPEITGFEVTKILFALDTVEPLTLTVTLSEFHKSPKN